MTPVESEALKERLRRSVEVQQIARYLSGLGFTVVSYGSVPGKLRLVVEVPDDAANSDTREGAMAPALGGERGREEAPAQARP